MAIEIVRAEPGHLPALSPLFDQYRVFYEQKSDLMGASLFLEARMKASESVILLCFLEKTAVGFVQLYPFFTSVGLKRTWVLNDLYVGPEWRKSGIGKALLVAARDYGISTGAAWLLLQTAANNFAGQALYEKCGWKKQSEYYYELIL
jgi:ribosomal protein S18 acetylase RimI-like enzyme